MVAGCTRPSGKALARTASSDYLADMALFQRSGMWRDVSPGGAIGDFITVFKQAGPNRWRYAFLAMLPPLGIFYVFAQEEGLGKPPPPKIDYITTFRPDRSEAEIVKSNIEHQKVKDQLEAEQARRAEETRQIYKSLGRMSGMDVDAIERKAKEERAAAKARAESYGERYIER
jgi:hypothetical protein